MPIYPRRQRQPSPCRNIFEIMYQDCLLACDKRKPKTHRRKRRTRPRSVSQPSPPSPAYQKSILRSQSAAPGSRRSSTDSEIYYDYRPAYSQSVRKTSTEKVHFKRDVEVVLIHEPPKYVKPDDDDEIKEYTQDTASVDKEQPQQAQESERKSKGIFGILSSPHRKGFGKSVPVSSEPITTQPRRRYFPCLGPPSPKIEFPPSPAPVDPLQKRRDVLFLDFQQSGSQFRADLPSLTDEDVDEDDIHELYLELDTPEYEYEIPVRKPREYYPDIHKSGRHRSRDRKKMDEHDRKIIIEFCHLLEKSKQLFNGLRELPPYGHKQWHIYFGRTFDIYTKLWKFQQQHRAILDSKYGLKRWQIGEVASKIGQLYYHFYLRTSETAYLNEAFSFYYAIRGRSYYTKASKEDKCELMVKKLRYYARFIVVSTHLNKLNLTKDLINELDKQIIEYGNTYDPDDQLEWTAVMDEIKAFIEAITLVAVIHPDNYPVALSHRLTIFTTPPIESLSQMNLFLQEALIIGSSSQQVKFSELTIDMFRMVQTLEREPLGDIQHMYDGSPKHPTLPTLGAKGYLIDNGSRQENPHKYLLYKPSPSQALVYLGSGCEDLHPHGALLLYISADGHILPSTKHAENVGYDTGGVIITSKNDVHRENKRDTKNSTAKHLEPQCLYPGDIYPFTRKPLFIIVDSDHSHAFQNMPRHFGQPLVVLMSPLEIPACVQDRKHQGNLFTLFLHSPLTAVCVCCDVPKLSMGNWDRGQIIVDSFVSEASYLVTRNKSDTTFLPFLGDDFLRLLFFRYIFCEMVLRMHRAFRSRANLPRCLPALPDDLFEDPTLTHIILTLANHLQVRSHFHDPSMSGLSKE